MNRASVLPQRFHNGTVQLTEYAAARAPVSHRYADCPMSLTLRPTRLSPDPDANDLSVYEEGADRPALRGPPGEPAQQPLVLVNQTRVFVDSLRRPFHRQRLAERFAGSIGQPGHRDIGEDPDFAEFLARAVTARCQTPCRRRSFDLDAGVAYHRRPGVDIRLDLRAEFLRGAADGDKAEGR